MTITEVLCLAGGLAFIAALGMWHLAGLLFIKRIKPSGRNRHYLDVLTAFWGLLILHASEIALCAATLKIALALPDAGTITDGYGDSAAGLVYLAGIAFTTLGFSAQTVAGPIRLLILLQALGGFMLLTWSATFAYSVWQERFTEG